MLKKLDIPIPNIGSNPLYNGKRCYVFKLSEDGTNYLLSNFPSGRSACEIPAGEFDTPLEERIVYHLTVRHKDQGDVMYSGDYIVVDNKIFEYTE